MMLAAFGYVKCCVVPASPFSEIELNRSLRVPLVEGTGQLGVTSAFYQGAKHDRGLGIPRVSADHKPIAWLGTKPC